MKTASHSVQWLCVLALTIGCGEKSDGKGGRVVWVYDGDSFRMRSASGLMQVRVFGIDCPEIGQPYAVTARQFVVGRIMGKGVVLIQRDRDRYGRIVADVVDENGADLGDQLLRAGLAWHVTRYDDNPRRADLEKKARQEGRGLWADESPIPPWRYRRRK